MQTTLRTAVTVTLLTLVSLGSARGIKAQAPEAIVLVAPDNGATGIDPTGGVVLQWQPDISAAYYFWEVAEDDQFTAVVQANDTGSTAEEVLGLAEGTTYYWRVRAFGFVNEEGPWSPVWTFTTSGTTVQPPALISPANGSLNLPLPVTLVWDGIDLLEFFEAQVATDPAFADVVYIFENDNTSTTAENLVPGGNYFWRVRKLDGGPGPWSDTWTFTTSGAAGLDVPILLTPQNFAVNVDPTFGVVLTWSEVTDATRYHLQVIAADTTIAYENIDIVGTLEEVMGLDYGASYAWRVRAKNPDVDGPWSEPFVFTTMEQGTLSAPVLFTPANGQESVSVAGEVQFAWQAVPGAERYGFALSDDPGFGNLLVSVDNIVSPGTGVGGLQPSKAYYWRVRALTTTETGPWSATWTFSTESGDPVLPPPTLGAPDFGEENVEVAGGVLFSWDPVDGATRYEIEVALDQGLGSIVYHDENVQSTAVEVLELAESTMYFWRVRAHGTQPGEWSIVFNFTTAGGAAGPGPPPLVAPEDGLTGVDPGGWVTVQWTFIDGALSYDVQIAREEAFIDVVVFASPVYSDGYLFAGLTPSTTYWWRVRAVGQAGTGPWSGARSFSTGEGGPLVAPTLTAPANGATGLVPPVELAWSGDPATETYEYEVAEDNQFSESSLVARYSGLMTMDLFDDVEPGATYYWRVRRVSGRDVSDWSEVWSFSVSAFLLPTPVLTSPDDMVTGVPTQTQFSWESIGSAVKYRFQVSEDPAFAQEHVVVDQTREDPTTSVTTWLSPNTTYWWRVMASSSFDPAVRSDWAVRSLTTGSSSLTKPVQVVPADATTGVPIQPTLQLSSGNTEFIRTQIATTPTFEPGTIRHDAVDDNPNPTIYTLDASTTYYWRARSEFGLDFSDWTPTWSFMTTATSSSLVAPVPTAPADGAMDVAVEPWLTFGYAAVSGATSYTTHISTDASFATIDRLIRTSGTEPAVTGLSRATTYYWRVRASDMGGTSAWSPVWSFSTFTPPSITAISPTIGPIGTAVTVTGSDFTPTPEGNVVRFGAVAAEVTSASDTQLHVTVPPGATTGPVAVTTNGVTYYSPQIFQVTFNGGDISPESFTSSTLDVGTINLPTDVQMGDLDGDGLADLVIVQQNDQSIRVLRNLSTPLTVGFGDGVDLTGYVGTVATALGDFDNDGRLDVAAVASNARVMWYRNESSPGTLAFATRGLGNTFDSPGGISVADMDLDGRPDLLIPASGFVNVQSNNTIGDALSFTGTAGLSIGSGQGSDVAGADLDGDGMPDLIAVVRHGPVYGWRNNGTQSPVRDGSFETPLYADTAPQAGLEVEVADLNGDGLNDVVLAEYLNGKVIVVQSRAVPGTLELSSFEEGIDLPAGAAPKSLKLVDMSGDGLLDIIVANDDGSGTITVLTNMATAGKSAGPITFGEPITIATGGSDVSSVAIGDLNGDGIPEVLASSSGDGAVRMLSNVSAVANETVDVPVEFSLRQNYPNPFNPTTTIQFTVPVSERVDLRVYDVLGREVRRMMSGVMPAGTYDVRFDARDLASGLYVYRLRAGSHVQSRTMVLAK